jgi:hypothetical protein
MHYWPAINLNNTKNLNETTNQIHHAVQFLAAVGVAFVEHQADDSHTNMAWDKNRNQFMGHSFSKTDLHLALQIQHLELQLHDSNHHVLAKMSLIDKTQVDGSNWIIETLNKQGLTTHDFSLNLHYEIPEHPLASGAKFSVSGEDAAAFSAVRTIGDIILQEHSKPFEHASSIRTWPHHFDHGSYIPIAFDEAGKAIKSFSIGLAIHDDIIPEHYFYITHWMKDEKADHSQLPELPGNGYWNREQWTGAVLKISDVAQLDSSKQKTAIDAFMQAGIQASLELLH